VDHSLSQILGPRSVLDFGFFFVVWDIFIHIMKCLGGSGLNMKFIYVSFTLIHIA
jgi:hypothetical protein